MLRNILLVGAGSFIGGALRYIVSILFKYTDGFPWATFAVNLIGCLIIGLLWGLFTRCANISQQLGCGIFLWVMVGRPPRPVAKQVQLTE